jgi:carbamoyltransferase
MKDLVNTKIKFREPFRPFAPAVLSESVGDYFDFPEVDKQMAARFMLLVVPVLEDKKDAIPAVNHLGTSRIQTVYQDVSPRYHELIRKFGDASDTPVLLNTSFNVRGEPIVNSPQDALNTFGNSGIDSLVMGNFLVDKT